MGATEVYSVSRQSLFSGFNQDRHFRSRDGNLRRIVTVKACYKAKNRFLTEGTYWSVKRIFETLDTEDHADLQPIFIDQYIMCYLVKYYLHSDSWVYREYEESCHPYYYDCPLLYLRMTNLRETQRGICNEWREAVLEHHTKRGRKIGPRSQYFSAAYLDGQLELSFPS